MCLCVPESHLREQHGAGQDFPPCEGAFRRCPLQGQRAASPRVVGGMVIIGKVTLCESMRHVFGGGQKRGPNRGLPRLGVARVVLLGLGQRRRLCIGCGVGQSAYIGALGGELEDDAPFCLLLRGPLVGFALERVKGDLVARFPAVW